MILKLMLLLYVLLMVLNYVVYFMFHSAILCTEQFHLYLRSFFRRCCILNDIDSDIQDGLCFKY